MREIGYIVVSPRNCRNGRRYVVQSTLRARASDARKAFMETAGLHGTKTTWKHWSREGWKVMALRAEVYALEGWVDAHA